MANYNQVAIATQQRTLQGKLIVTQLTISQIALNLI